MLIRAQDKVEIVNLDNIVSIYTIINNKKETEIKYHAGQTLNNRYLGTYSSEEKALKVLDMIQNTYAEGCEWLTAAGKVFVMPADDEVNV